ncbi:single-stranded DNA-binding protein [Streptomyces sp. NPDC001793]|uniref:single-stranded DNA-binding protein n=1 Tax=Streptomyces sp. NPDC001793 TaxID=3154657 RepID=UPI00332C0135
MNDTMVTLVGNVATAVEHRETAAGVSVARFRMAATSRRWDRARECWTDGETSFYTVRCWRALADNVAASVAVGEPLVVQGRLRLREGEQPPEKGGQRWFAAEVDAMAIGHDLARGTSAFRRVSKARKAAEGSRPAGEVGGELATLEEVESGTTVVLAGGPERSAGVPAERVARTGNSPQKVSVP